MTEKEIRDEIGEALKLLAQQLEIHYKDIRNSHELLFTNVDNDSFVVLLEFVETIIIAHFREEIIRAVQSIIDRHKNYLLIIKP